MVVTENSPLGPIFQKEFDKLGENGIVDYIRMEWIGKDFPKDSEKTAPGALGQGQVTMIFIILCVSSLSRIAAIFSECN